MAATKQVTFLRSGNNIVIDPTPADAAGAIKRSLTYTEKVFHKGWDKERRRQLGLGEVELVDWDCWVNDHRGRIATSFGFVPRIQKVLAEFGYAGTVRYASATEAAEAVERAKTVYLPQWDRIDELIKRGFKPRHGQIDALQKIAAAECGRIDCPPGWGKGTAIGLICVLYPRARIAVVTRSLAVLQQRLFPELAGLCPSVGIVCSKRKVTHKRVMCYGTMSLGHSSGNEDIVLVDECHEACADRSAELMARFTRARLFGFSASHDMRLDNKDMRAEAMFGSILVKIPYAEAEAHGMVVPIEVLWSDVIMDVNPCAGLNDVDKKRAAYWRNDYRNDVIAQDAREVPEDAQTLITVDTVEHMLALKKRLPEYETVYAGQTLAPRQMLYFRRQGLIGPDFRVLDDTRRDLLTSMFERGTLKKVIATTVWNVGVDFHHLEVLLRADGGASPVRDTQIPGRTSRIGSEGKNVGIIRDYRDQFDTGCHQRAKGRERNYLKHGWAQHSATQPGMLARIMGWGVSDGPKAT